ncbi:MAG: transglycosylase SLT domain-containing protein [Magnetococcales bacterium]|nr:transglycosylase SLT domain-containing protein [Magnetococcales bacterium]
MGRVGTIRNRWVVWGILLLLIGGCASRPSNIDNACSIFADENSWYDSMRQVEKKWKLPIHVQLAIIHQESKFTHNAKPPRKRLFWFIPGPRSSTAFGYAQVLDGTWKWYKEKTGNSGADRDNFDDAVDFIGWYTDISFTRLGISRWDAEAQYLAYHEGHNGYRQKTYLKKKWLMQVAKKVKRNASRYYTQLQKCRDRLEESGSIWPF